MTGKIYEEFYPKDKKGLDQKGLEQKGLNQKRRQPAKPAEQTVERAAERATRQTVNAQKRRSRGKAGTGGTRAKVFCVMLALVIVALGVWANTQMRSYEAFMLMRSAVAGQTFYKGISVDGVSLEGMTMNEAMEKLARNDEQESSDFNVVIASTDKMWRLTTNEVPLHRNTEATLKQAYSIGRYGTLEERYEAVRELRSKPVNLETSMWYDKTAVRNLTDSIAGSLTTPMRNATVTGFDFKSRTFVIEDASSGMVVNADTLYNNVVAALDMKEYGKTIEAIPEAVWPTVTRDNILASYGRVAGFTTRSSENENRNANITLATQSINGSVVQPGEIISFNEKTGQRTYAKGYREAGAISNGQLIDEVGGGVCQVSTTLFNALIRANMSIVMRNPHAWPVDYIEKGEDAMVNWPDKDLKMRNDTDEAFYVVGYFVNRNLTFEVYGKLMPNGAIIDLKSEVTKTTPPGETEYKRNTAIPAGHQNVTRQARTGYQVATSKVVYENGKIVSETPIYKSTYPMYSKVVEYNQ